MSDIVPIVLGFDSSVLAGRVSPSSIAMYTRDFKAYLQYAGQEDALVTSSLERWITHLVLETTKSPNTINRMVTAVKQIVLMAAKQGYITYETAESFHRVSGVKVGALKGRMRIRNRVKIEPILLRKVIDSFQTKTLIGLRNKAMFTTLASSGLRIQELITLQRNQIVQRGEGYLLIIHAEQGKNLEEDREANISVEAVEAIDHWLQARSITSDYIFTSFRQKGGSLPLEKHISAAGAWAIIQRVFKKHGMPHVKPHDLRRFVATQLAKTDIRKAQRALGHKDIKTTIKYDLNEIEVGVTDHLF